MGVALSERGMTQVSMNIVDYQKNALYRVLELIRMEARRWGVEVVETEIYGMIPAQALLDSAAYYLQVKDFDPDQVLELKLLGMGDDGMIAKLVRNARIYTSEGSLPFGGEGPGGSVFSRGAMVIRNGKIEAVGPEEEILVSLSGGGVRRRDRLRGPVRHPRLRGSPYPHVLCPEAGGGVFPPPRGDALP